MSDLNQNEHLSESLRQERETFDQHKSQQARWFNLRLYMGYIALVMLPAILLVSILIIFKHEQFPGDVVSFAAVALFVDLLGLLICVWKIVLNPGFMSKVAPVTTWNPALTENMQKLKEMAGDSEKELLILSAVYGAEGITNDVTEPLRKKIRNGRLELQVTNYEMGGDPRPSVRKTLTITYIYSGNTSTRVVSEGDVLRLP